MIESVRDNKQSTIEYLLQQDRGDLKADIDFKDSHSWSSLHYAAHNGNLHVVTMLISLDADVNITNNLL